MFKILIFTVEIRIIYLSFAFFSSKYQNSGSFSLNRCLQVRIFSIIPTRTVSTGKRRNWQILIKMAENVNYESRPKCLMFCVTIKPWRWRKTKMLTTIKIVLIRSRTTSLLKFGTAWQNFSGTKNAVPTCRIELVTAIFLQNKPNSPRAYRPN